MLLYVLAKITNADKPNIDALKASLINLALHLILCKISVEFNVRNGHDSSVPVSLISGKFGKLLQGDTIYSNPVHRLDKGHNRAHGCNESR